MGGLQSNLN